MVRSYTIFETFLSDILKTIGNVNSITFETALVTQNLFLDWILITLNFTYYVFRLSDLKCFLEKIISNSDTIWHKSLDSNSKYPERSNNINSIWLIRCCAVSKSADRVHHTHFIFVSIILWLRIRRHSFIRQHNNLISSDSWLTKKLIDC